MKRTVFLTMIMIAFLFSCDGGVVQTGPKAGTYRLNGLIQKGPFYTGTSITIQELDDDLTPNGVSFQTTTIDDFGTFSLESKIRSRFVEIIATGFYFNEITGAPSNANLTLRSLADLENTGIVNVNILTSLERNRIIHLFKNEKKSMSEAQLIAEKEIMDIFLIKDQFSAFNQMDISKQGDSNAMLLAISAIMT